MIGSTVHYGDEVALLTHLGTVRDRVDRGVAALDEFDPAWKQRVDPKRLDLRDGRRCVCGQVFDEGEFAVDTGWALATQQLGLWDVIPSPSGGLIYRAHWLGFAVAWPLDSDRDWHELRAEWLRRLA